MQSIFSTQNETNSIAQIALTKKQQKEDSGVKFGNALLKANGEKITNLVVTNSATLAKTQAFNTAKNTTNLPSQSDIFTLKIETQNTDNATNLLADMLKSLEENATNPMLYGYSVDDKGFMGLDFNVAAGLPQDFKIHSSTLEKIYQMNEQSNWFKEIAQYYKQPSYFDNIDIVYTIKWNYGIFSQLAEVSFEGKTSFSEADLEALPRGFSREYDFTFMGRDEQIPKLIAVYKDKQSLQEADALEWELFSNSVEVSLGVNNLDEMFKRLKGDSYLFNPDISMYKDGKNYTIEALFVAFMNGDIVNGGQTQVNPYIETMQKLAQKEGELIPLSLVSFEKVASGEMDLMQILKLALEKGLLDMALYAEEQDKRLSKMSNPAELERFYEDFQSAKENGYKPNQIKATAYINNLAKEFLPKIQAIYTKYGV